MQCARDEMTIKNHERATLAKFRASHVVKAYFRKLYILYVHQVFGFLSNTVIQYIFTALVMSMPIKFTPLSHYI